MGELRKKYPVTCSTAYEAWCGLSKLTETGDESPWKLPDAESPTLTPWDVLEALASGLSARNSQPGGAS